MGRLRLVRSASVNLMTTKNALVGSAKWTGVCILIEDKSKDDEQNRSDEGTICEGTASNEVLKPLKKKREPRRRKVEQRGPPLKAVVPDTTNTPYCGLLLGQLLSKEEGS